MYLCESVLICVSSVIIIMNKIINYIRDSWIELKKVSWPSKQETYKNTIMVIVVSISIAAFLGLADYGLNLGLEQLIKIKPQKSIEETQLDFGDVDVNVEQEIQPIEIQPDDIELETDVDAPEEPQGLEEPEV